jgi:hypothetical protein
MSLRAPQVSRQMPISGRQLVADNLRQLTSSEGQIEVEGGGET